MVWAVRAFVDCNAPYRKNEIRQTTLQRKTHREVYKTVQELCMASGELLPGQTLTADVVRRTFAQDVRRELDAARRALWRFRRVLSEMGRQFQYEERVTF